MWPGDEGACRGAGLLTCNPHRHPDFPGRVFSSRLPPCSGRRIEFKVNVRWVLGALPLGLVDSRRSKTQGPLWTARPEWPLFDLLRVFSDHLSDKREFLGGGVGRYF